MISNGEMSETDLAISKILLHWVPESKETRFLKSYEGKQVTLIKLSRGSVQRISPHMKDIQEALTNALARQSFFFEEGEQLQSLTQRLFYPAKIASIRQSWLPDGTSVTTIKVSGRIGQDPEGPSEVLSLAYGRTINISFQSD